MGVRDKIVRALLGEVGGAHPGGIAAYHSSPHDFDRFDLSKIGSGEGAQVYGHGIYAAENPMVSGQGGDYWNSFVNRFGGAELNAAARLQANGFDRQRAIASAQKNIDDMIAARGDQPASNTIYHNDLIKLRQQELELLQSGAPVGPRTYEINIRAQPEQMLNWDKPLSEQPAALQDIVSTTQAQRAAAEKYRPLQLTDIKTDSQGLPLVPHSGGQAYQYLTSPRYGGNPTTTAAMLNEAGIPGIQYLDQGSRAMGGGTSNYVVFDPSRIDILQKYGVIGAPAGALGMGAIADQSQYEAPP